MADYGNNNRFSGSYGSGNRNNYNGDRASGDRPSYGGGGGGGYGGGRGNYGGGNRPQFQNRQAAPIDPDPYIPVVLFTNPDAPLDIKEKMKNIVQKLNDLKFTIRAPGGNNEVDEQTRTLATKVENYLPWKGYENQESKFSFSEEGVIEQACKFHPAADKMKDGAKKFLARNLRAMQGQKLQSPAKILIGWSEDGASKLAEKTFKTGNFGHLLSIAAGTKTPVFNLGKAGTYELLMSFLEPEKEPELKREAPPRGHERPQYGNRDQGRDSQYGGGNQERNYRQEESRGNEGFDDDDEIDGY